MPRLGNSLGILAILFLSTILSVVHCKEDVDSITIADGSNEDSYLPEFPTISRSIIGRATGSTEDLQNNRPATSNTISSGQRQYYRFPSSALHGPQSTATPRLPGISKREEEEHHELRKRDNDVQYYLTLSVCSQPTSTTTSNPPEQLVLLVSYQNPNPDGTQPNAHLPNVQGGFSSFSDVTSGDIYLSVQAPSLTGYTGSYSFELTVSIDDYYSNYVDTPSLYLVDSDWGAASFVSTNLTNPDGTDTAAIQEWLNRGPQYTLVVASQGNQGNAGIMHSFCALKNSTVLGMSTPNQTNVRVETGITDIGGEALQQQFLLAGLQNGSSYSAAMALVSNYTTAGSGQPGGGGIVFKQVDFFTKSSQSCQLVYNMTFCNKVNWAVPSNTSVARKDLAAWYDDQAYDAYQFFDNAIQQVACDTYSDAQYSLAVNCTDCEIAYKDWLCAVMAPRCTDYTATQSYLQPRAVAYPFLDGTTGNVTMPSDPLFNSTNLNKMAYNQSRNPQIDAVIQPGPYKELLPCGDVCYKLVRSCPAVMGFACPYSPQGFDKSYGYPRMDGLTPQCNYPGMVFGVSSSTILQPSIIMLAATVLLVIGFG